MKRTLFLFLTSLLLLLQADGKLFAQKNGRELADSLIKVLETSHSDDTNKVKLLSAISGAYRLISYDTSLKWAFDGLQLAKSLKWKKGMGICYSGISVAYRFKGQYPEALENNFKALKMFEETGERHSVAIINEGIGNIYLYQDNFNEAMKYQTAALKIFTELGDKNGIAGDLGDMGNVYWKARKYDSALAVSFRSLALYEELGMESQIPRTLGNIGMIYNDSGSYEKSLEYNFKSLNGLKKTDNKRSLGIRYGNIGDTYLNIALHAQERDRPGALSKAIAYIDSGNVFFKEMGDLYDLADGYKSRYRASELLGDYKSALEYHKAYITTRDSVFSNENKVKIARIEAKHEVELVQIELEKRRNEKWFLISCIVLLAIIGTLFINRQMQQRRRLEAEKKYAENELGSFRQSVYEKNLIIEQVTGEMEKLKKEDEQETASEALSQLQHSIILTDDQWSKFQVMFEKVHKNFFYNLKKKMPDLTQAEIRLLALTRLKLSSKEMAAMMGISPATIRIYRHRLRKKLELDKEEMIEELIEDV